MKAVLVNYNYVPEWLLSSNLDYHIFDRSDNLEYLKDFPKERITHTENIGQVDYDKLNYLATHYDNLPDVFLWGKTNLFKYISEEEYEKLKDNKTFTPLLTQSHKTFTDSWGPVSFYCDNMYYERNEVSWKPSSFVWRHCSSYPQFAKAFGLPAPPYLPFAPGGNYILTKEVVHRYPKEFYEAMASILPHDVTPLEAYFCERAYYTMWQ